LFLSLPVSGAGTFCDGIMGAGTWREVGRRLSATGQEDFTIDKLKEAIQVYVTFESRTSTQTGAPGLDRVRGQKWRELVRAAKAMNLSKDELEQLVAAEIVRQAGVRGESSRVVTQESIRRADQVRKQHALISIDGTQVIMHRIEPGEFMMGEVIVDGNGNINTSNQVKVELSKPFYLSATPTTQIVWRKVAELVNSRFGNKYNIDVNPSRFKGDLHPVDSVSYEDIQTWIIGLNELSQLGAPTLSKFVPDHEKGDVYRLPTEAEWEFVVRGRGQYNDTYHFGNQESQLGDHAWFSGNSGSQTHPVGQKKPLVINGREFHDMHGNVWEWVHDWYGDKLPGGTDPQGPKTGSFRVRRGGSWSYDAQYLRAADRYGDGPGDRYSNIGFRLARSARNP